MADGSSSPATGDPNSQKPEPITPIPIPNPNPNPSPTTTPQQHSQPVQVATLIQPIPPPYAPSQIPGSLVPNLPPPPPPFRPGMQFTPVANFQNPNSAVPPPGVNPMTAQGSYQPQPGQQLLNQAGMRPFQPMTNGYPGIHGVPPPGAMPLPAF